MLWLVVPPGGYVLDLNKPTSYSGMRRKHCGGGKFDRHSINVRATKGYIGDWVLDDRGTINVAADADEALYSLSKFVELALGLRLENGMGGKCSARKPPFIQARLCGPA